MESHFFLLPLEILPLILSTIDARDRVRFMCCSTHTSRLVSKYFRDWCCSSHSNILLRKDLLPHEWGMVHTHLYYNTNIINTLPNTNIGDRILSMLVVDDALSCPAVIYHIDKRNNIIAKSLLNRISQQTDVSYIISHAIVSENSDIVKYIVRCGKFDITRETTLLIHKSYTGTTLCEIINDRCPGRGRCY
jgi:hypothetical protein